MKLPPSWKLHPAYKTTLHFQLRRLAAAQIRLLRAAVRALGLLTLVRVLVYLLQGGPQFKTTFWFRVRRVAGDLWWWARQQVCRHQPKMVRATYSHAGGWLRCRKCGKDLH